jgi:hemin uptake protein HemP
VNLKEAQKSTQAAAPRQVSSSALLKGSRELLIAHNGRSYRLRLTKNGKLILTA